MHAIACSRPSLQFRVFRLSFLQDGDVGVAVFPEDEEVLVGSAGLGEGGAWERGHLARSLLFPTGGRDARAPSYAGFQCVRSAQAQVRQRADRLVQDDARVVENFLEFGGCRGTLVRGQVRLAPQVDRVKGKSGREGLGPASPISQSRDFSCDAARRIHTTTERRQPYGASQSRA